ncbi:MAG: hypothetical protein Q9182_001049 [Xanthomendoza sp. 2 TL-2023]
MIPGFGHQQPILNVDISRKLVSGQHASADQLKSPYKQTTEAPTNEWKLADDPTLPASTIEIWTTSCQAIHFSAFHTMVLESENHDALSQRPLKKKKSLARLFSTSRSSSRSRPPSIESSSAPPTPTIPEQYLSSSRKASTNCETPSSPTSISNVQSLQPTHPDDTNKASVTDGQSESRASSIRGILKAKSKGIQSHGNLSNGENTVLPIAHSKNRPRKSSNIHKPQTERSTVKDSSSFPQASRTTGNSNNAGSASPPRGRNRGASASLSHDLQTDSHNPPRPSTSGGERRGRLEGALGSGSEDFRALGLRISPLSSPIPISDSEIRASLRSAMTSASSIIEPGTARSSVVTKNTSVSDVIVDPRDAIEDGMTVDEAIGMYENGFVDDNDSDHDILSGSSVSEEERRRSMRIAEAINDTIGPHMGTAISKLPSMLSSSASATVPTGPPLIDESRSTPSIMPPTETRDQYGFLKASRYVDVTQYDQWESLYAPVQFRRAKKFTTYMREQGCATSFPAQFPDRSPKTLRYIRKGIPPAWRGAAWFYYSGGSRLLETNPDTYSSLVSRSTTSELSSNDIESIERDLHRTFPDNIYFKPDQPVTHGSETVLLSSLRRLLRAFAIYRPQIGYCQSLNFLAGLLLLFLPEEKAFWMLHIITTDHLPGTHDISLEGANVDLWVLMLALKESNPSIWAKVGVGDEDSGGMHTARLPPISLCTTSWFMSMFIGTLPIESVLRVWDVVFYEGSKMLFRFALAIFKMGEPRIKEMNDPMELFQVVQALPKGILDIGVLQGLAYRRGGISQEWITKKRKERRKWYAKEKARVAGAMTPIDAGDSPLANGSPDLSQANSAWRRRVGLVR